MANRLSKKSGTDNKGKTMAFFKGLLTILLVFGPTFYFGITKGGAEMGIAAAAGAAVAMLLNTDRISEITLLGFKAKLKEVIGEAHAKLDAVQSLATEAIAANIRLITRSGRWDASLGLEDSIAAVDRFRKVAEQLEIQDRAEFKAALEEHHDFMAFDFYRRFYDGLKGYAPDLPKKLSPLCKITPVPVFPAEQEILAICEEEHQKLQPEDRERLEDYLFYRKHCRQRRL